MTDQPTGGVPDRLRADGDERDSDRADQPADSTGQQVSQAGGSFDDAETSGGGADSVPDTPDHMPENITETGSSRRGE